MRYNTIIRPAVLLALVSGMSACATGPAPGDGFMREVPEQVVAVAAPGQNLQAVKWLETDDCFWYSHSGPVETTLLPLRNRRGQHICAAREAEAEKPA